MSHYDLSSQLPHAAMHEVQPRCQLLRLLEGECSMLDQHVWVPHPSVVVGVGAIEVEFEEDRLRCLVLIEGYHTKLKGSAEGLSCGARLCSCCWRSRSGIDHNRR